MRRLRGWRVQGFLRGKLCDVSGRLRSLPVYARRGVQAASGNLRRLQR